MGMPSAKLITDNWHLRKDVEQYFLKNKVSPSAMDNFHSMLYAISADDFYTALEELLHLAPSNNPNVVDYIRALGRKRIHYAAYIICKYPGARSAKGSNAAKQNHSSMLSHVLSTLSKRSKYSVHNHVKELMKWQQYLVNQLNKRLTTAHLQKLTCQYNFPRYPAEFKTMMEDAFEVLSTPSYELFGKEMAASMELEKTVEDHDNEIIYKILRQDGKFYSFTSTSRCQCRYALSYLIQCRHEICGHRKFLPDHFDKLHMHRQQASYSTEIGSWVNETSLEVYFPTLTSHTYDGFMNDNCVYEGDNSIIAQDVAEREDESKDEGEEQTQTNAIGVESAIITKTTTMERSKKESYREMQTVVTTWLTHYSKQSNELKQLLTGIVVKMNESMRDGSPTATIAFSVKMSQVFRFLTGVNAFMIEKTTTNRDNRVAAYMPAHPTHAVNRMKSSQEVYKNRVVGIKACSFCKTPGHNVQLCPTRGRLGTNLTLVDFLYEIQNKSVYRLVESTDIPNSCLPEGAHYLCVLSVIVKRQQIQRRYGAVSFPLEDLMLETICLNNMAIEIGTGTYEATTVVNSKCCKREVFLKLDNCSGVKWLSRR